ncbi:unnamed protein product [Cochlearia groenlandica]
MYEWKEKWRNEEDKPSILNDSVWTRLKVYWGSESARKKAKRNVVNRRGGDETVEKPSCTHNAGANTFEQISDNLRVREGGVEPHWLTMLTTTHTNKATGQIENPKVRDIVDRVNTKIIQLSQNSDDSSSNSNSLSNTEINQLVLRETPLSRGRPFGLGSLPETQESTFPYVPSSDIELLRGVNRLKTQVQEKDKAFLSLTEQLNKMNAYMMNRFEDYDGSGSGSGVGLSGTGGTKPDF